MPSGVYKRTKHAWNYRLTKETDERVKTYGIHGSETKKNLYREGKIKTWNKDLTKETDIRLKKVGEKSSKTIRKKYANGYVNPMKGKKRPDVSERLKNHKGKTYEELYGKEKAKEMKLEKSIQRKGTKLSKETRKKQRLSIIKYLTEVTGFICPRIGHNEKQILDKLEQMTNTKILRQYEVEGYFLDGYIKDLNVAIEVDEFPKIRPKDIERQKIIEDKLRCKFIRIKDYD